ncbi:MAG TPA: Ni/Fe hydrogenase subunit alpha [Terriglobales bacterium]|nr:Ni/Fe hydrogenase subunit alpha [Terriglobales bacterium]
MSETAQTAAGERVLKRDSLLTRVEGEGGVYVRWEQDRLAEVRLDIFEPPRFFEAFLRGRHLHEVPDITARICGICPVAYQMSSVHALEAALGIVISPAIRRLRRLLYCAEWIQSHALHIYLLEGPDFLGYESALSLAKDHPELVERGLRLKKVGNDLLEVLGGRATHPVSVCVGGFYKTPRRKELMALHESLVWGLEAARTTARWAAQLTLPELTADYEFVALSHPDEYPMNEGRIVSSSGLDLTAAEFERHFLELQVAHSTALHSVRTENATSYLVGPLARLNLNRERLAPQAREVAHSSGLSFPLRNPFAMIIARSLEMLHAFEEALSIVESYEEPAQSAVECKVRAGEGCAATEAPRGLLYHRYRVNERGLVDFAKIVPPTAQNLRRIEDDLRLLLPRLKEASDEEMLAACENLVRAYDPCISCSTHFLKLTIDRSPRP